MKLRHKIIYTLVLLTIFGLIAWFCPAYLWTGLYVLHKFCHQK